MANFSVQVEEVWKPFMQIDYEVPYGTYFLIK